MKTGRAPGTEKFFFNIYVSIFQKKEKHFDKSLHGEFWRLLLLQARRETEAHFTAAGVPSQRNQ